MPTATPSELPVERIFADPNNIRRQCEESGIAALADTIRAEGLLQPITVRPHPSTEDSFLISYGERRWRAVRLLGWPMIAAIIEPNFDPYRQAIENLQREELTPLEVAAFIAKREAAGDSRTEIAKRLGKSKSFISELARLATAPPAIHAALHDARIDTRTAYLLTRHHTAHPDKVEALLARDEGLARDDVSEEFSTLPSPRPVAQSREHLGTPLNGARRTPKFNALAVVVGGRTGVMSLRRGQPAGAATVHFADGSEETAPLSKISLKHWVRL